MTRKPTAYILLLVTACALLAGCGRSVSDADRLLARIESLADVNPDSADVLLIYTPSPSLKGGEKEVWELLRIKIDDKLYRPVTHYRDTILQLIDYFERHPRVLPRLLGSTGPALPYLYAGRIYSDLGDAPQALDYYQRALDVMPVGQIENGEWKIENEETRRLAKQRGLILSQIGEQFFFQGLHYDALHSYRKANYWAKFAKDTADIIFNLRDIAEQYKFLEMNDSSLFLYKQALNLAKDYKWEKKCNELMSQMSSLYIKKSDFKLASEYIRPSLENVDTISFTSTYAIASKVYKHTGKVDSAVLCYHKLLEHGNLYGKSFAHKELAEIALLSHKNDEAYQHLLLYTQYENSLKKRDNAEIVAHMHAAYNYQKHEREAHELKAKNDRMRVYLLLLSSAVVVMLLLAGLVAVRRRYKRQLVQSSMGKTDLLRYSYEQKTEQQKLSEREQVAGSTIYAAILSHLGKAGDVPLSDDEWQQLHQTVNAVYPNFREKLTSLTPMNNFEYQVCLLLKIGVKPSEIASLTAHSRESVTASRRRLYEKAMKKSGKPSDWDALVTIL